MSVIIKNKRNIYVTMTHYHLRDDRLSLEAKGLQSWLLSTDKKWTGEVSTISKFHPGLTGEKLNSILNELQNLGYIKSDNGDILVFDVPEKVDNNKIEKININNLSKSPNKKLSGNLFSKCNDYIYTYTDDTDIQSALRDYLFIRLNPSKDSRLITYKLHSVKQWENLVNTLDSMKGNKEKIIKQSIEREWAKFVDIEENNLAKDGLQSNSYNPEEIEYFKREIKKMRKERDEQK